MFFLIPLVLALDCSIQSGEKIDFTSLFPLKYTHQSMIAGVNLTTDFVVNPCSFFTCGEDNSSTVCIDVHLAKEEFFFSQNSTLEWTPKYFQDKILNTEPGALTLSATNGSFNIEVQVGCNKTYSPPTLSWNNSIILFQLLDPRVCYTVPPTVEKMGWFRFLFYCTISFFFVYMFAGSIYRAFILRKTGTKIFPHHYFWGRLFEQICCLFIIFKDYVGSFFGRSSYIRI